MNPREAQILFLDSGGADVCGAMCFFWHPIMIADADKKTNRNIYRIAHSFRLGDLTMCF